MRQRYLSCSLQCCRLHSKISKKISPCAGQLCGRPWNPDQYLFYPHTTSSKNGTRKRVYYSGYQQGHDHCFTEPIRSYLFNSNHHRWANLQCSIWHRFAGSVSVPSIIIFPPWLVLAIISGLYRYSWVFSSKIPSSIHKGYDPSKSTTSIQTGYRWKAFYDGGRWVIGDIVIETVNLGGITIDGQAVGVATATNSAYFLDEGLDGFLGLGFLSFGENFTFIFFFILFKSPPTGTELLLDTPEHAFRTNVFQGKGKASLPAPLFTVDLKKGKPGSCDFGFVDDSKFIGKITYVPVDSSHGYWSFDVKGYNIGTGSPSPISIKVIADTGSDFVFLPHSIVDAYYAAVPGAFWDPIETLYFFPCGSTLPSITFNIGTYKAVLPGSFIESSIADDSHTSTYLQSYFFLVKQGTEGEKKKVHLQH